MWVVAALVLFVVVAAAVTVAVMRSMAASKRDALIRDGEQHASDLTVSIAVEEDRAERRHEQDVADDAADMAEGAAVVAVILASSPSPGVTEEGIRGGMMPTSKFDEDLGL